MLTVMFVSRFLSTSVCVLLCLFDCYFVCSSVSWHAITRKLIDEFLWNFWKWTRNNRLHFSDGLHSKKLFNI